MHTVRPSDHHTIGINQQQQNNRRRNKTAPPHCPHNCLHPIMKVLLSLLVVGIAISLKTVPHIIHEGYVGV